MAKTPGRSAANAASAVAAPGRMRQAGADALLLTTLMTEQGVLELLYIKFTRMEQTSLLASALKVKSRNH